MDDISGKSQQLIGPATKNDLGQNYEANTINQLSLSLLGITHCPPNLSCLFPTFSTGAASAPLMNY